MDCLEMDFANNIFTTILDKGLLDSISSGYRSFENCVKYVKELYRVMKNQATLICISHSPSRVEEYFNKAGVEWADIEIIKIYKPLFERESVLIREEFVSKEVLDKIDETKRVRLRKEDEENANTWAIVPDDEMSDFKPKVKEERILNPEGGSMPDIPCHYVYILTKDVEESVKEEEGEEEEEAEENENNKNKQKKKR